MPALSLNSTHSYRYGVDLERNAYPGRPADYLWAVVWLVGLLLASTAAHAAVFLGPALVNALLFTWSRFNPTARVSFFGIFTVDGAL